MEVRLAAAGGAVDWHVGWTGGHVAGVDRAFVAVVERDGGVAHGAGDGIAAVGRAGVVVTDRWAGKGQVNDGRRKVSVASLDAKVKAVCGHRARSDGMAFGCPVLEPVPEPVLVPHLIVVIPALGAGPASLEEVPRPSERRVAIATIDAGGAVAPQQAEAQRCSASPRGSGGHGDLRGNDEGERATHESDVPVSPAPRSVVTPGVQRDSGAG